jgi:hypothetical protein
MVICLTLLSGFVRAQAEASPVKAEWALGDAPEGGWTVGYRLLLRLTATHPAELEVTLPELPSEWGPFEVLEQAPPASFENRDNTLTTVREATITLWAPGDYQTPPLAVRYRDTDDQLHEVSVPPLSLSVVSVLTEGETEKRDLKSQVSLPRPPLWPWVLGGLLLVALSGVGGRYLLTRLRRQAVPASIPGVALELRSPEEIAYDELDRIDALDLPTRGELKRHYTLVADCMRTYIEGRYNLPALDRTTQELSTSLRRARVDRDHAALLRDLLTEADLVKFARARPPLAQARTVVAQASHIVDVTKMDKSANRQIGKSANSPLHESRITNPESQIPNHESQIPNHESQITNHESRIT